MEGISPGRSEGNDSSRSGSSRLHATLEGMKFACVPSVEVIKCVEL